MHDAQRHAGAAGGGLGPFELLVQYPLKPAVQVDPVLMIGPEPNDGVTERMT